MLPGARAHGQGPTREKRYGRCVNSDILRNVRKWSSGSIPEHIKPKCVFSIHEEDRHRYEPTWMNERHNGHEKVSFKHRPLHSVFIYTVFVTSLLFPSSVSRTACCCRRRLIHDCTIKPPSSSSSSSLDLCYAAANIHRWPRVLIANISYRHARVVLLAWERHGTGLGAAWISEDASDGGDDDRICAHVRIKAQRRRAWTGVSIRGVI